MIGQGRHLDWSFDPIEAMRRWPAGERLVMLHSGRFHPRWARRSILARPAGSFQFIATPDGKGISRWVGESPPPFAIERLTNKPFHDLGEIFKAEGGLWIGHLSYDLGRWVEKLPSRAAADRDWPIVELAWCPGYFVYDTAAKQWYACGAWRDGGAPGLKNAAPASGDYRAGNLRGVFDRPGYEAAVARVKDYIASGDIFQANLAQRFTADFEGETPLASRALFEKLTAVSPAWYGAYLELASDPSRPTEPGRAIASTSPELFLELDANANVVTRPIKGTRPASVPAEELRRSVKDTAELTMIVDLLRNDLGRVCAYGSVRVPQPREIETHPTVHHGVATVTGLLHRSMTVVDLLRATMPGGSITGAPKVRAMEIIDELEPVRRGPYCGAIGFFSREETCLNIAIRTMLIEQPRNDRAIGRVDFSVGGGIVADSDPASEYQETLDKAAAVMAALGLKSR